MQRPHIVQPVGELDHQHPDVSAHRDDHLADRLRLRRLPVFDLVQLGATVDEQCDLLAELVSELSQGVVGVFYRVVQQGRDERHLGHAQLGEDSRHGERMGDEGISTFTRLALVQPFGPAVCALDQT